MEEVLSELVPGLEIEPYYDAWRLLVILWRALWYESRTNWRAYARRIWQMFADRVKASARMARDLDGFLANMARAFALPTVGGNLEERTEIARLLALPPDEQRRILRQLRQNTPVLVMLLRLYRDKRKEELEATSIYETEE